MNNNEEEIFISSNLKYLIKTNKTKLEDLSKLCNNKSTALISMWASGKREPDTIDTYKLARYFNLTLDDFVGKDLRFEPTSSDLSSKLTTLSPEQQDIINKMIDNMK